MRERDVDEGQPQNRKQHEGGKPHPLRDRARDQRNRDDRERHLVDHEQAFGDRLREGADGRHRDPGQEDPVEPADVGAIAGERQSVAEDHPEHRNHRRRGEALSHGGEHVLLAHHAAIKERQPRHGHHQNDARGDQHPRGIRAIDPGGLRPCRRRTEQKHRRSRKHAAAKPRPSLSFHLALSSLCGGPVRGHRYRFRLFGCAPHDRSAPRKSCRRRSRRSERIPR